MVRVRNRNTEQTPRTTTTPAATNIVPPREPENPSSANASSHEGSAQTRTVAGNSASAHTASSGETGTRLAVPSDQRSLATPAARNAFEAYGQQMSVSSITGTLIKFDKGDWVTGDDEDLEQDTELVANMDQLMVGWIKWVDNRPAEQIMGPVAEGYQPQRRNELGDTNSADWEVDNEGRPRDPWQFSNYIVLKDPGQDASTDNLYTFATSSKGGLGALGALCKEYGKEMRRRPDEYPIIKLGVDSYQHREFGRIKVPLLTIVGWEPKAQFDATRATASTPEPEAEPEPAPPQRQAAAAGGRRRAR